MATRLNSIIKDIVPWSSREEIRNVFNIPIGTTLVEAWFMIKINEDDDDPAAILFKTITPTLVASAGHIDNVGTFTAGQLGVGHVIYVLTASETGILVPNSLYFYGMKAKLSNGKVGEFEQGELNTVDGIIRRIT